MPKSPSRRPVKKQAPKKQAPKKQAPKQNARAKQPAAAASRSAKPSRIPRAPSTPSKPRSARAGAQATRPASARKATAEPTTDTDSLGGTSTGLTFPIEVDPARIEQTLKKIGDEVSHWAKKGRYTKVRFKFRGKQLLPDLPLAAVVAAEGLTFYWGGILRALLVTVGANAVFGVELVNDSAKKVLAGKEKLLRGDLDEALSLFREAAAMDRDNPTVHLNIGIALKLSGDRAAAREALQRARDLDPKGPIGEEAEKVLSTLPSQMTVTSVSQHPPPQDPDRPSGAV